MSKTQQQPDSVEVQMEELRQELAQAQDRELRAKADYQNLVRRSQQDRAAFVKMAAKDLITDLLQPLMHLELAAAQIKDPGLDMVVQQFKSTLQQYGLEEIDPLGEIFNIETMEVVEAETKAPQDPAAVKVKSVTAKGYRLNGEVIQHAKVVMGK